MTVGWIETFEEAAGVGIRDAPLPNSRAKMTDCRERLHVVSVDIMITSSWHLLDQYLNEVI